MTTLIPEDELEPTIYLRQKRRKSVTHVVQITNFMPFNSEGISLK